MKNNIKKHVLRQHQEKHPGYILYRGKSAINSAEIIAILTTRSSNKKIGNIAQITYIPIDDYSDRAERLEKKQAVCGACPLLGKGCYVMPMGTNAIKRAFLRGNYTNVKFSKLPALLSNYIIRNGQDGDPLSIPYKYVNAISELAGLHISYTHLWRENPEQAGSHMASVESLEDKAMANKMGYKTFRIIPEKGKLTADEMMCLNVENPAIQCATCQLCDGGKANIAVPVHGVQSKKITFEGVNHYEKINK